MLGDRIKQSAHGAERNIPKTHLTGRVVGFGERWPDTIHVVRDGRVSRESYHMSFWELVERPEPAERPPGRPKPVPRLAPAPVTNVPDGPVEARTSKPGMFFWRGRWRTW